MDNNFKLFAVGPVEMYDDTFETAKNKVPYFRTDEFSKVNFDVCDKIKKYAYTQQTSNVVILTASGTASMEAAVMNLFNKKDKVLIINGGSFGQRFVDICNIHNINNTEIKLYLGKTLKKDELYKYSSQGYTGLLINADETSTGVYYDLKMIGEFCKQEGITFVVDAISSFLADSYYMDKWNIDVTIVSSQKALALPPGLSFIITNKKATEKIMNNNVESLYFDLKRYIVDMKRGQTPFTPAVGTILQLHERLLQIEKVGIENIIKNTEIIANDFRNKIKDFPFTIVSESLSNAVTPLSPRKLNSYDIFTTMKNRYGIYVCPNGGELKNLMFRVGHMGNLSIKDNDMLIKAFNDMMKEGLI